MTTENDDAAQAPRQDGSAPSEAADPQSPEGDEVQTRPGVAESEHLLEIERLRLELDKERGRTAEMRDALMRTAADFENFRKRMDRDRVEERKQAGASVVKNLLPVLDAVGRALASTTAGKDNAELQGFMDGIRMVETQLVEVLRQAGLERIETEGVFDPAHHEALMQEPSDSVPHMTILDVFEPGYRLGGRLLRPARVKVAYNPGGEASPDDDASRAEGGKGEA